MISNVIMDTLFRLALWRLYRPGCEAIHPSLDLASIKLNLGGSVHDPTDPVGRLLFNVLAMVAEFESDLIRMRTREGMKIAKAGRLRGKLPNLSVKQERHLVALHSAGEHTSTELAEVFNVGRSTVYCAVERSQRPKQPLRALPCVMGQLRE
jgi:DNA invertase Pin-like site-specific DNA recombinase